MSRPSEPVLPAGRQQDEANVYRYTMSKPSDPSYPPGASRMRSVKSANTLARGACITATKVVRNPRASLPQSRAQQLTPATSHDAV